MNWVLSFKGGEGKGLITNHHSLITVLSAPVAQFG